MGGDNLVVRVERHLREDMIVPPSILTPTFEFTCLASFCPHTAAVLSSFGMISTKHLPHEAGRRASGAIVRAKRSVCCSPTGRCKTNIGY